MLTLSKKGIETIPSAFKYISFRHLSEAATIVLQLKNRKDYIYIYMRPGDIQENQTEREGKKHTLKVNEPLYLKQVYYLAVLHSI